MTRAVFDPTELDVSYVVFKLEAGGQEFNTKDDWMLLKAHVEVGDPQVRKYEVTVPGRDGVLDLSDALGGTYYENRDMAIRFLCMNWEEERFHLLGSTIRNAIEGKKCRITFAEDLGYFWRGRPQVGVAWNGNGSSTIEITANVEPYKYNALSSYDPWLWDSFSFVTGVVTDDTDITLDNETKSVLLPRDPARGKPTLWLNTGNARARVSTDQTWHVLKSGANVFPEIRMSAEVDQTLLLNGTGSVGVEFRLGSL